MPTVIYTVFSFSSAKTAALPDEMASPYFYLASSCSSILVVIVLSAIVKTSWEIKRDISDGI